MSSFHVDARIDVKLEIELALRLGEMLLASGTEDKQILALGHMLSNIDKDEPNPTNAQKWTIGRNPTVSSIVSDWQEQDRPAKTSMSTMREKVAQNRRHSSFHDEKWGVE